MSLPGAELPPGTYIFEHVTATDPDVIVVRSGDRAQVYYLGFTDRLNRPRNVGRGSAITLGEARPGAAPPIAAWYPPDSSRGHGLIYR